MGTGADSGHDKRAAQATPTDAQTTGANSALDQRQAGILLHPTSLPGPGPSGDLGHAAYRFVEFLAASGMGIWQTLPLGPTHTDGSPYQCLSVHAGNAELISLDWLVDRGWLAKAKPAQRGRCLGEAYRAFAAARPKQGRSELHAAHDAFVEDEGDWLEDYALYAALRAEQGGRRWLEWPADLRDRDPAALAGARERLADEIAQVRFEQFVFFRQWSELRRYAHEHGVRMFGDMPIFVAHDSAEVWAHREYFAIDEHGKAQAVAGVPPDYFSATGQRWGNPHYRWKRMKADGFKWWIRRMHTQLELFDLIRVDHFRGFEAYWEIPADAETAMQGRWVKAPGKALLSALYNAFDALPLVAEDLGVITAPVEALRRRFALPGMKILQFAFGGGPDNPYLPHNHEPDSVVYTGTHDNDTTLAWYRSLDADTRAYIGDYLGHPKDRMPWPLIRSALASVARLAVVPMQDVLGLGAGHHMNRPGTTEGNWGWRFTWDQVAPDLAARLNHLTGLYGRRG